MRSVTPRRGALVAIGVSVLGLVLLGCASLLVPHGGPRRAAAPDNELAGYLFRLVVALALIGVAAHAAGRLAVRLRQPRVVGEMVAGLAIGPSLLGAVAPGATELLLPPEVVTNVNLLGTASLMMYMFAIGSEFEAGALHKHARTLLPVSAALMLLPMGLGMLAAVPTYPLLAGSHVGALAFVLFVGTALSVTAFPVLARIVDESGLRGTRIGSMAMLCAAYCDVLVWCALAVALAINRGGSPAGVVWSIGLTIVLVIVVLLVLRPAIARAVHARRDRAPSFAVVLTGILTLVLGLGALTELLGVHAIFGAFLAGFVLPRDNAPLEAVTHRLSALNRSLLLPVYFASVGLQVDVTRISARPQVALAGIALLVVAIAGKFVSAMTVARAAGWSARESGVLGVLMNTRGVTEVVVLGAGLSAGVLNRDSFTAFVVIALVTTVMAGPLLSVLGVSPAMGARQLMATPPREDPDLALHTVTEP